jgi:hypothetical protein
MSKKIINIVPMMTVDILLLLKAEGCTKNLHSGDVFKDLCVISFSKFEEINFVYLLLFLYC